MKSWSRVVGAAPLAICLAAGCGSASENGGAGFSENGGGGPGAPSAGDDASASGIDASSGPPETKAEGDYQSPVATGQYVWIANPTSGRVAYIQASTLEVATVDAGDGPDVPRGGPGPFGRRGHRPQRALARRDAPQGGRRSPRDDELPRGGRRQRVGRLGRRALGDRVG